MDYQLKTKNDLIEEIIFYENTNLNEDQFSSLQEIDFDESLQEFIDADNYIIFEE